MAFSWAKHCLSLFLQCFSLIFLPLKNMEGYTISKSNQSLQLIYRKTRVHVALLLISFAQLIALGPSWLLFHPSPHKEALNWSLYLP